jgi:uncharacterized surface protein with fasciclin (FAS1) repeats
MTLRGSSLRIDGTNGVKVDEATMTMADANASNGVVHGIDRVLIPMG